MPGARRTEADAPPVRSADTLRHLPGLMVLAGFALLAAVPRVWWPEVAATIDGGDWTWVLGVVVQNTLLLLLLAYALRHSATMRSAALGEAPITNGTLKPALVLLLIWLADLAVLWWGFADGDPMVLDRAAVVLFAAALLTGPRIALWLGALAIPLRIALVPLTEQVEPLSGTASPGEWLAHHVWIVTEPGVVVLPVGLLGAVLLAGVGCGARTAPPCALWTAFGIGLLTGAAYLAAAGHQWEHADWARYWAAEATVDALSNGLAIALFLMLLRGLRGDLEQARKQAAELALAHERLQALRAQTRPHFLFNALNTIHSLIAERPDHARELLLDLSDLLRATLTERGPLTTLRSELDFVRQYLALEQARFGPRLELEYRIDPACEARQVPVMLLQPLAENAIKHGIAPYIGGGTVTIAACRDNSRLIIEVSDHHPGNRGSAAAPIGTGTGLDNLGQRLKLLHRDAAVLTLRPDGGHGHTARIELPWAENEPGATPPA